MAVLSSSCGTSDFTRDPGVEYAVRYYDRNHDGKVDFEWHRALNQTDSDWALMDTSYSGFYTVELDYGYAFAEKHVYIRVPQKVRIEPGGIPLGLLPE